MRSMRYEARGTVVYDREEDKVVDECKTEATARVMANVANRQDQEWREIDSLMRTNRSLCG